MTKKKIKLLSPNGTILKEIDIDLTDNCEVYKIVVSDNDRDVMYKVDVNHIKNNEYTGSIVELMTSEATHLLRDKEQNKLVGKLLKASNEIHKNRTPNADCLILTDEQIQDMANIQGITFAEMSRSIKEYLLPKQ
tara:strand:+ start:476 stop:880 length:405 start_codon:yes stop_codon:yes gene_type:complete